MTELRFCHCGERLQLEIAGPDTHYFCCPKSHYMPGHVCYIEEDEE